MCTGVSFRNSSLNIISSFVIRHPCFVILIVRGMVEQSEIWTRMSVG
jgi:hypothetical protein